MYSNDLAREQAHLHGQITLTSREFDLRQYRIECPDLKGVPNSAELILHRFKTLISILNNSAQLNFSFDQLADVFNEWIERKGYWNYLEENELDDPVILANKEEEKNAYLRRILGDRDWFYWDAKIENSNEIIVFINVLETRFDDLPEIPWLLLFVGASKVELLENVSNIELLDDKQKSILEKRLINNKPDFDFITEKSAFNKTDRGDFLSYGRKKIADEIEVAKQKNETMFKLTIGFIVVVVAVTMLRIVLG